MLVGRVVFNVRLWLSTPNNISSGAGVSYLASSTLQVNMGLLIQLLVGGLTPGRHSRLPVNLEAHCKHEER